eukprot:4058143-Amphidinium_carterae.1
MDMMRSLFPSVLFPGLPRLRMSGPQELFACVCRDSRTENEAAAVAQHMSQCLLSCMTPTVRKLQ